MSVNPPTPPEASRSRARSALVARSAFFARAERCTLLAVGRIPVLGEQTWARSCCTGGRLSLPTRQLHAPPSMQADFQPASRSARAVQWRETDLASMAWPPQRATLPVVHEPLYLGQLINLVLDGLAGVMFFCRDLRVNLFECLDVRVERANGARCRDNTAAPEASNWASGPGPTSTSSGPHVLRVRAMPRQSRGCLGPVLLPPPAAIDGSDSFVTEVSQHSRFTAGVEMGGDFGVETSGACGLALGWRARKPLPCAPRYPLTVISLDRCV